MNKSTSRKQMDKALREIFVSGLRQDGFKGTFPHIRRMTETRVELISFQYGRIGGTFAVNLGVCDLDGIISFGRKIPAKKVRAFDVKCERLTPESPYDHWFVFADALSFSGASDSFRQFSQTITVFSKNSEDPYTEIAQIVLDLFKRKGTEQFDKLEQAINLSHEAKPEVS
ncbi:MAG: DUF4304 domain-containing protein [Anaerolineae bacterium]|nr:DUF4304 domain-containing protein [Anaerolineae bacterium]